MRASAACPLIPASFFSERSRMRLHGVAAVERRVRVLEDDLERAQVVARPLLVPGREELALEQRRARRRRDDPEQRPRERRLAAARLADETERLARPDRRADVDERVDVVAALVEHLAEVVDLDERRGRGRPRAARGRRPPREAGRALARGRSSGSRAPARPSRAAAPRCGSGRRRARSGPRTRSRGCSAPRLGRKPGIVSSRP